MKYNIAQVIGLNTDQKAAQVLSSSQDSATFLAVVNMSCDDAFTKGRQFLSETYDYYFEAEGSPAEKIEVTFKQAVEKLKASTDNFDLLLAIVAGKVLYLVSEGKMEVYLKRTSKLSSLLALGSPATLISGFLQDGDKVLFSSASLTSFLGEDLGRSLDQTVEKFEEEVSSKITTSDLENGSLAGLILELSEEEAAIPTIAESASEVPVQTADFGPKSSNAVSILTSFFKLLAGKLILLKSFFPKSGRSRLILGIVLIMIILLGIGYKYKDTQDRQRLTAFNQVLQKAREDFSSAQGLQNLDPTEARTKLDSAKSNVLKALSLSPKNSEALNLKKQIEDSANSILQQFATAGFPVFLDLDLVKKNFRADKMSLSDGKLLLLDSGTKTLITINLSKKSNQILAGSDQLGDALAASLNGGLAFVYSKDKGIVRVDITNQKQTSAAKKDADLGTVADIYGFAGNVYLLDNVNQKIWKYLPTNEGYSDKREYLSKDVKVDFTNSLRMQIESSIYVLKRGGEVLRFTKGDKDNFSLSGLDKGVKDPKSFFVSSDTDNLYLLDSGNSRLLVLTKTGQFKSQYSGDKFGTATDLAVDEQGKKVYLLDGSKIYSTDLK